MRPRFSICGKFRVLVSLLFVSFVTGILSGCFSAGDDFYSYVVLKGALQRNAPDDLITVEVDSRGTLLSNEQENDNYEVSIGAVENCEIIWTINNERVQTAVVHKTWDTKNHLTGLKISVKDERSGTSWTVSSKTPDSREWVIELKPDP